MSWLVPRATVKLFGNFIEKISTWKKKTLACFATANRSLNDQEGSRHRMFHFQPPRAEPTRQRSICLIQALKLIKLKKGVGGFQPGGRTASHSRHLTLGTTKCPELIKIGSKQLLQWIHAGAQWKFHNMTPRTDGFRLQCDFSLQDIAGPPTCYAWLQVIWSVKVSSQFWMQREQNTHTFPHASWDFFFFLGTNCQGRTEINHETSSCLDSMSLETGWFSSWHFTPNVLLKLWCSLEWSVLDGGFVN